MTFRRKGGEYVTQQNKKHFALSMALMALALLTTACYNSADKQAGSTLDAETPTPIPTAPEDWRRVQSIDGSVTFAVPPDWKMDSRGVYYKNSPDLEEAYRRPENSIHDSIADIATGSIYFSSFDAEGKTVDQLWQEGNLSDLDVTMNIGGERARVGMCGGLWYEECAYTVRNGIAYVINVRNASFAQPPLKEEGTPLYNELRQIINSLSFSK